MIKSVKVDPVTLDALGLNSSVKVFVCIDAAELAAAYVKKGINPASINVPVDTDDETMSLADAVASKIDVSVEAAVRINRSLS